MLLDSMEYSADIKTVKKWEEELNCRLEKEIKNNKVVSIKCIVCKRHEDRLKVLRSFIPMKQN